MRTLGLDVGINSIGFALIDLEYETIICTGVHLFDKAEQPKTGASLALPRRNARGQRRVIRRRAQRKRLLKELFETNGIPTDFTLPSEGFDLTPWELRAKGLERKLTPQEFGRVLYHLAKRRGFQSNRKDTSGKSDAENTKMLGGANALESAMEKAGYLTIGAYLADQDKKRNGNGEYSKTVLRKLVKEETQSLFEAQRTLENPLASTELEQAFTDVAFYQRPLKSAEALVGDCSLETNQKRAPKFSRSAELFVLWQRINHIRLELTDGTERELTSEQRIAIFEKCHETKTVKYGQLRKIIGDTIDVEGQPADYTFKGLLYRAEGKKKKAKTKTETAQEQEFLEPPSFEQMIKETEENKFIELTGFHAIKEAFGLDKKDPEYYEKISKIDTHQWDKIASILAYEQTDLVIEKKLIEECQPLTTDQVEMLCKINSFKGTVGLSAKAITKILPWLEIGETYDKACLEAGYNLYERVPGSQIKLPQFEKTRNPVVDRALAQCRKVINAVIIRYGIPDAIHIELAREVGKSWDDRDKINRQNKENEAINNALRQEAVKLGVDVLKYRLWKEQAGYCMYSGEYIEIPVLQDSTATQIDHILPHSRTFDDSRNNLTLCLSDENQKKGKDTPWEYLGHDEQAWQKLEGNILRLPWRKRRQFLVKNLTESQENSWKERHLNDTRWIARELKNHIEKHLDFSSSKIDKKRRVITLNGKITAVLRRQWGLSKNREESARHHAQDALVIACTTWGMVQKVTNHEKYKDRQRNLDVPKPWPTYRDDVLAAIEGVFVSRLPNRKMTGELHAATVSSLRKTPDGRSIVIKRVGLTALKLETLEKLVDKERNIRLYQILKARLEQHDNKAEKAFKEPIYMPTKTGVQGPRILSVRIVDDAKNGIEIRDGIAANAQSSMVRLDIFEKNKKYFLCPIYTWDVYKEKLPEHLIKIKSPEEQWPIIDETYQFKFSLHPGDLVKIQKTETEQPIEGYYTKSHRSNAAISLLPPDQTDSENAKDYSVQGLYKFEKYVVNVFGERYLVKKEKRLGLANPSRSKSCLAKPQSAAVGM